MFFSVKYSSILAFSINPSIEIANFENISFFSNSTLSLKYSPINKYFKKMFHTTDTLI